MSRINKSFNSEDFLPNTTQVPNVVLDWMMSQLSGAEFKVLMFFVRQRYGFRLYQGSFRYSIQEIMDGISAALPTDTGEREIKKVCDGTGLKKDAVLSAIEGLEDFGALEVVERGDRKKVNAYKLLVLEHSLVGKNDKTYAENTTSSSRKKRIDLVGKTASLRNQGETNINQGESESDVRTSSPTQGEALVPLKIKETPSFPAVASADEKTDGDRLYESFYSDLKARGALPVDKAGKVILHKHGKAAATDIVGQVGLEEALKVFKWGWANWYRPPSLSAWSELKGAYDKRKKKLTNNAY